MRWVRKRPKVCFCGPPGTGKTLLAKAVAGEAGVPFYATSGADFVEMYVGVGRKESGDFPCRGETPRRGDHFIDEVDAVGRPQSGDNEPNRTGKHLNALLVELDGFTKRKVVPHRRDKPGRPAG